MQVPLSVDADVVGKQEKLVIWANGKRNVIDSPIKPYFYSSKQLNINAKESRVEKIRISDYRKKTFYKYEFDTRKELTRTRDRIREEQGKGITFEDNIPFTLRNRIDNPDVYTKYKHTDDLTFNFLDIEQFTRPKFLFPTYDDQIVSIAWSGIDKNIKCAYLNTLKSDKVLLEHFKKKYVNPDVVVLYNKSYDLPTLFERYKRNDIDTKWFSNSGTEPYVGGKRRINIDGMVIYDVFDSTSSDQTLSGNVPNKGLKAVSDYFGFKTNVAVIDFDKVNMQDIVGTKQLVDYNKDDIRRLIYLFDIYWQGIVYTAEDLRIPISDAVNLSTTDLGIIILGDLYREHGIICDGDNYSRYPEIFQRKKKPGVANYQGALTFLKKRGLFKNVKKADYGSMYPRIAAEFNFSPDTCTILRYEPYKKSGFKIEEDADTFTYTIPDKNIKKNVIVQALKREGFLSKAIKRFLDERDKFKKEHKRTGSKIAKARSSIAKVKANGGLYGNHGSPKHPFGFAPIAVATTGIGRECAKLLIDVLEKLYPGSVIEVDTDGVYFDAENANKERIIHYFNLALEQKFKKKLALEIDIDDYESGFFHKAKNYFLKTKKGTIILHGVAMKASSKDAICKNLIMDLARAKLEGKATDHITVRYKQNLHDFSLRDFAMQVQMGMHLYQYKNQNCISVNIAMQAQRHFNVKPQVGNSYHYIKANEGYILYQLAKKEDIDFKYYRKKVDKILDMLESEYALLNPISSYLDGEEDDWEEDTDAVPKTIKKAQPMKLKDFL